MDASFPGVCGDELDEAFLFPCFYPLYYNCQNSNCINKLVLFWDEGFS